MFIIDINPAAFVFGGTVMDSAIGYANIMLFVIVTAVSYVGKQGDRAAVILAFASVEFDVLKRQLGCVAIAYASAQLFCGAVFELRITDRVRIHDGVELGAAGSDIQTAAAFGSAICECEPVGVDIAPAGVVIRSAVFFRLTVVEGTAGKLFDFSGSLGVLKADSAAAFCRASFKGNAFKADIGLARNADRAAVALQGGTEDELRVFQIKVALAVDRSSAAFARVTVGEGAALDG